MKVLYNSLERVRCHSSGKVKRLRRHGSCVLVQVVSLVLLRACMLLVSRPTNSDSKLDASVTGDAARVGEEYPGPMELMRS